MDIFDEMNQPDLPFAPTPFRLAQSPALRFGWGIRDQLAAAIRERSRHPAIVISRSVAESDFGRKLRRQLPQASWFATSGEPSPESVDALVREAPAETDWVIGIGGGSALDTAKAAAGLIPSRTSVMDYLEGVGRGISFSGPTLPWLAVPTTAGTGSETTKNAVISRLGQFKKSFRHDSLLAREAWLDPAFLETLPQQTLHHTAMDALTQLIESYVTRKANPITDALAWQGVRLWRGALEIIENERAAEEARRQAFGRLMLAATLSGIALANAGLGAVHGLAGPVGAFFEAPHGAVCAALLAPVTRANIDALRRSNTPEARHTLHKYAQLGRLLNPTSNLPDERNALQRLIDALDALARRYGPDSLARYGLRPDAISRVLDNCRAGSMLGNPTTLSDQTLESILIEQTI